MRYLYGELFIKFGLMLCSSFILGDGFFLLEKNFLGNVNFFFKMGKNYFNIFFFCVYRK